MLAPLGRSWSPCAGVESGPTPNASVASVIASIRFIFIAFPPSVSFVSSLDRHLYGPNGDGRPVPNCRVAVAVPPSEVTVRMAVQTPAVHPPGGAGTSTTLLCSGFGPGVKVVPSGFLMDQVSAVAGSSWPATSPEPRSESVVSKTIGTPSAGLVIEAVGGFGCDGVSLGLIPLTRFQPSLTYGT